MRSALTTDIRHRFFAQTRKKILDDLTANRNDRSIAGGVDPGIRTIVDLINSIPQYFSLSSCSGRVSFFHRAPKQPADPEHKKKRGGGLGFLFTSHDPLPDVRQVTDQVLTQIANNAGDCNVGTIELKFEPVILHVRCRELYDAQELLEAAASAGLRKSGMIAPPLRFPLSSDDRKLWQFSSSSKQQEDAAIDVPPTSIDGNSFIVSIGSNAALNNLLAREGKILMTPDAVTDVLTYCNEVLFVENESRKTRLEHGIRKLAEKSPKNNE